MINIHIGDSYVLVEPYVPAEIEKMLTYWHRSFEYDPAQFKNVVRGEVRKLYTIRSNGAPTGTLGDQMILTTLPGFAAQIKTAIVAGGEEITVIDERLHKPDPDMESAMSTLRDYQYECTWTMLHSRGGICGCPTGWG